MDVTRRKAHGAGWLAFLLAAGLAAQGCVPYTSNYKRDPRTRKTTVGIDRAAARAESDRLILEGRPSAEAPYAPVTVRVSRTLTGPEATITTFEEKSYRRKWTPLLIPVGLLIVPTTPFAFIGGVLSMDPKVFDVVFGGDPDPCRHGMFGFGLHAAVGISTSCTVADRRIAEDKQPTGKTVSVEDPVTGKAVEFRLTARGEEPLVRTYETDSAGRASLGLQPLVRDYRDYPVDLEMVVRVPPGGPSETVRVDAGAARQLYLPIAEERAGDRALAEGKGLVALEHFSRTFAAVPNFGIFTKVASTYRSIPVKPPVPEDTRRLLVQAETLSRNNDSAGAIRKLYDAIRATPWFPAARYNLAMAYAMDNNYGNAIFAMNTYLDLAPDAPDARQARDRIYEWETLAPGNVRREDSFVGIGLELRKTDGRIVVARPLPGGPAERAGIRPEDVILQIDGASTEGMEVVDVATRARGKAGTTVPIRLLRPATGARFDHVLRRETIRQEPPSGTVPGGTGGRGR